MTKYINEFNPNSRQENNGVQEGLVKLKFNNIQSCIAVGIVPEDNSKMIGVHLTQASTHSKLELKEAISRIKGMGGNKKCSVYLVASYSNHRDSYLLQLLKDKLTKNIYLCDLTADVRGNANIDVKMIKTGNRISTYIRIHAENIKDDSGHFIYKAGLAALTKQERKARNPGKSDWVTDRDSKPWSPAIFRKI